MADLKYSVEVDTRGAIQAIKNLETAVTTLIGAVAVDKLVGFADSVTNLRNKLLTLTPSLDVVNKQMQALQGIAITARSPLDQTAELFFRIQRASKALGISQQEAAQITLSLSKAISASGLSSAEAAGALLQLGQALQSGTFQGDELRSILENLPPVAQAIADQLGVPVGALKKLGSEGQISADVFVQAMRKAKDGIDEAFGRTTPTITGALESLRTNAKLAFNEFENNTQTGRTVAAAIEYIGFTFYRLTKNIDEFAGTIATIAKWTAIVIGFTVVGRIVIAVAGTFATLGRAVYGVGKFFYEAFTGVNKLGQAVGTLSAPLQTLAKILISVGAALFGAFGGKIVDTIKSAYDAVSGFFDKMSSASDATSNAGKELEEYRKKMAEAAMGLDTVATNSENAAYLAKQLANTMASVRLEMEQTVAATERQLKFTGDRLGLENDLLEKVSLRYQLSKEDADLIKLAKDREQERDGVLAGLNDQLAKMNLQYSQLVVKDSQQGKELAGRIGLLKEQIGLTTTAYNTETERLLRLQRENQNLNILIEDRKRTQDNIIKSIEDQIKRTEQLGSITRENLGKLADVEFERTQLGRSPFEKQIAQIQENARKGALAAGRAFADSFGEADLTPEKAQELADGLAQIEGQFKKIADAQIANLNSSRTWEQGWKEAFGQYMDNATNAAAQAKQAFDNVTRGFEDAIVKFVQTGKLSFKDFANTVIAEMTRMSIRQFLGGAGGSTILGSLGSWFKGLFGFANGGVIPTNGPVIVGERGPEIVVGAAGRNVIPNHQLGGASYVTYNINAVDSMSFKQMLARDPSFLFSLTEQGRRTVPTTRR